MAQWKQLEDVPRDGSSILLDFSHVGHVAAVVARPEMTPEAYRELGARGWVPCAKFVNLFYQDDAAKNVVLDEVPPVDWPIFAIPRNMK